ncbi:MAG: hypothetical protein JWP12_332 [Bacteroidetes bacterium]|nr:hypothetical protein [Bacteroidota bacterium]
MKKLSLVLACVGMFSAATFATNSFTIHHQTPKTETKSENKTTPKKKKPVKKAKAEKKEKAPAADTKK